MLRPTSCWAAVAVTVLVVAACASTTGEPDGSGTSSPRQPVDTPMVRVADVGNPADVTGFGAVNHTYSIGKFEVTIGQYVTFLNAVARSDPNELYDPGMAENLNVAGIVRSGADGLYAYEAMENDGSSANRPVTGVSWYDAARFVNWLANGQPAGAQDATTTEDGAYALVNARPGRAPRVNRVNPSTGKPPIVRLPTEDEWYKAAYYSPEIGSPQPYFLPQARATNPNTGRAPAYWIPTVDQWYKAGYYDPSHDRYFLYATQNNHAPGNDLGPEPNQANYQKANFTTTGSPDFSVGSNYLTDVGAFTGSAGPFRTFDQNGNLQEWLSESGRRLTTAPFRGGFWQNVGTQNGMAAPDSFDYPPLSESDAVGFRVAAADARLRSQPGGRTVALELRRIAHPANRPDPLTGLGAVDQPFSLGRYEVTIAQYAEFLNAVARSDAHQLFNPRMQVEPNLAGISRSGSSGSYRYAVMDNSGSSARRPIGWVSWFDAARFANWLDNGQPRGTQSRRTTEDGVYDLAGAPTWPPMPSPADLVAAAAAARGAAVTPATPTSSTTTAAATTSVPVPAGHGGYYDFATASNTPPDNVVGPDPDQANSVNVHGQMAVTQQLGINANQNYLTDVGAFSGSPSYYGTFDQTGNVYEWNDLSGTPGPARGIRGSAYFGALFYAMDIARTSRGVTLAGDYGYGVGFRVAGP